MTIQAIIKQAIKRLELEGKLLTPDFYAEAFCKEAQRAGVTTPDCTHLDKFLSTLNKEFQDELKKYHIKNLSELTRFLISKLNRTNPSHCANMLEAQVSFTKKILQSIELLHNKEAAELSRRSFELLAKEPSVIEIEQYKQLWTNFISTYDDTFLRTLNLLGGVDTSDLKAIVQNINLHAKSTKDVLDSQELSKIAMLLISSLVPSISPNLDDKIVNLSNNIKQNPHLLEQNSIEDDIKEAIAIRIALDKNSVKEMIESIDGVLDKLSIRLIEMIESTDNSTIEIQKIKDELDRYNNAHIDNFNLAHKKLYTIAVALEQNTQALSQNLRKHSNEVTFLSQKIDKLEQELQRVKEESKEDFLTKLYNKRALDEFLNAKEAEFSRYNHNYAIVFFDLDFFKKINDKFGHDAGDAVLAAFAKILKSEARSVDIVGRFGGEEFIAILSATDTSGGAVFAEKVMQKVKKSRFMYKDQRIEVTVSAGVSDRAANSSLKSVIKAADDNLYKAKRDGRDRVVYK